MKPNHKRKGCGDLTGGYVARQTINQRMAEVRMYPDTPLPLSFWSSLYPHNNEEKKKKEKPDRRLNCKSMKERDGGMHPYKKAISTRL